MLTKLKVHDNWCLRPASLRGWAIRKNSPKLEAALTGIL